MINQEATSRSAARTTTNQIDLLGISTSLKPAPGLTTPSASRQYLEVALKKLAKSHSRIGFLDLRKYPLPPFDGRLPENLKNPSVRIVSNAVAQASTILLSVPCYWGGVSGVFKNFIDVICGPLYDHGPERRTPFFAKKVGLFLVGADQASSERGLEQCRSILMAVGAEVSGEPVLLGNPRDCSSDCADALQRLEYMGSSLLNAHGN